MDEVEKIAAGEAKNATHSIGNFTQEDIREWCAKLFLRAIHSTKEASALCLTAIQSLLEVDMAFEDKKE